MPRKRKLVAVGSPKGGVGKTTISIALAYELRRRGNIVGLVDLDFHGPTLPVMVFGTTRLPSATTDGNLLKPVEKDGVKIFSLGFIFGEDEMVAWDGRKARNALKSVLDGVDWSGARIVIADLPPGLWDPVIEVIGRSDTLILVTEPTLPSLYDTKKILSEVSHMVSAVILNESRNTEYPVTVETAREILGYNGRIVRVPFRRELFERPAEARVPELSELASIIEGIVEEEVIL